MIVFNLKSINRHLKTDSKYVTMFTTITLATLPDDGRRTAVVAVGAAALPVTGKLMAPDLNKYCYSKC